MISDDNDNNILTDIRVIIKNNLEAEQLSFLDSWNIIEINNLDSKSSNYKLNEKIILESKEENTNNETQNNDHNFNQKLQILEQIISNNYKKQNIRDYLRYRFIYVYFKYWKKDGLT